MYKFVKVLLILTMITIPFTVSADDGDIHVGEVDLSGLGWGNQTVNIDIENKTQNVKFIVARTHLLFEGLYANPEFTTKKVYILEPEQKLMIAPEIFIPGNYGTANIEFKLYDVVDTLDELMPWTKFFEQPFIVKFHPTDEILPYLQEKVTFPPRVDVHPLFNNEFIRILITLLAEGKNLEEIAKMNKCKVSFVEEQVHLLIKKKYVEVDGDSYKTTFPYITRKEAEDGKRIADIASDKLADLIAKNIKSYPSVLESMIQAKMIPNDKHDFLSGATLLFNPTPVVSVLALWFEMGKNFISRSAPLLIYNGTDVCNAEILQYMYMVDGGPFVNGSQFFGLFYGEDSYSLMFSEGPLQINCKEDFNLYKVKRTGVWNYDVKNLPEFFIIDTADARPLINMLTIGSKVILEDAYNALKKNSYKHGQDNVYIGHRYWMWNLIATLTLEKLYANGTLEKSDKEEVFYRFDKVKG